MSSISSHRWLIIIIGSCFTSLVLWAFLAQIDQVIRAPGTIEPVGEVHSVQSRFPGEISVVNVRLGQIVNENEVLFVLKPEENEQAMEKSQDRFYRMQARAQRLNAQLNFPSKPRDIPFELSIPEHIQAAEQLALMTEQSELTLKLEAIESKKLEAQIERKEARAQQDHFDDLATISRQEKSIIEPLVKDGLEPKLRLTQLERDIATHDYQHKEAKLAEARADQQTKALTLQSKQVKTEYLLRIQSELRDALAQLAEIQNDYKAAKERLSQTQIKAPIRGIVSKVVDVTPGSVYRGGDLLAELVPLTEGFVANIRIPTKERPNVRLEQDVRVSLDAYDFAIHGHVLGTISRIADNTTETESEAYYEALVEIPMLITTKSRKRIQATPGMTIQAEILGEQRTIIDYIFNPILRAKNNALVE